VTCRTQSYSGSRTEHVDMWDTFICYHVQEFQTFQNGPVFLAHPVEPDIVVVQVMYFRPKPVACLQLRWISITSMTAAYYIAIALASAVICCLISACLLLVPKVSKVKVNVYLYSASS